MTAGLGLLMFRGYFRRWRPDWLDYYRANRAMRREGWGRVPFGELVRRYPEWVQSLRPGSTALDLGLPWLNFRTIEFLKGYLRPQMTVCEFGSGGSTIFFARSVRKVISIEHDPEWHAVVQERLRQEGITNVESLLRPPESITRESIGGDPSDPSAYVSSDKRYVGQDFHAYARAIDSFPEAHFNLVLVDGRARPSCCKQAWAKVRSGGILMLDDSERPCYHRAWRLVPGGARELHFVGPSPCCRIFYRATAWIRGNA